MSTQALNLIENLIAEGITHPEVLNAIKQVPREKFVLPELKKRAYDNTALPIECEQTISQPYIVGLMTQALFKHPQPKKILEIGTGSGYQAAILASIFESVWTIERIDALSKHAQKVLQKLGYKNIHFKIGDGAKGWIEAAPYEGIIVTAAANKIPPALVEQLSPNHGIMVIPIGGEYKVQHLTLVEKKDNQINTTLLELVRFVPLISGSNSNGF